MAARHIHYQSACQFHRPSASLANTKKLHHMVLLANDFLTPSVWPTLLTTMDGWSGRTAYRCRFHYPHHAARMQEISGVYSRDRRSSKPSPSRFSSNPLCSRPPSSSMTSNGRPMANGEICRRRLFFGPFAISDQDTLQKGKSPDDDLPNAVKVKQRPMGSLSCL